MCIYRLTKDVLPLVQWVVERVADDGHECEPLVAFDSRSEAEMVLARLQARQAMREA